MSKLVHNVLIDDRLDSYRTFFDGTWADQLCKLANPNPDLQEIAFTLCANWKATHNTCVMPWLLCHSTANALDSINDIEMMPEKVLRYMAENIGGRINIRNMAQKQLQQVMIDLGKEAQKAAQSAKLSITAEMLWREYIDSTKEGSHEIVMAIWATQRNTYGTFYHTFEEFCRSVIALQRQDPDYRFLRYKDLLRDVKAAFGQDALDCLTGDEINVARLVRNALAHNGGKVRKDPKKPPHEQLAPHGTIKHDLDFVSDVVQIMAPHTRNLFNCLKGKVWKLTEIAVVAL